MNDAILEIVGPWGLAAVLLAMHREHLSEMRTAIKELAGAVRDLAATRTNGGE